MTAALGLFFAASLHAGGFRAMANDLASAAKQSRIDRVAVMPFVAEGGGASREGWDISERLVTQLVRTRRVKTVERSLLRKLLSEHRLGQTGILDPSGLKGLGRVFAVDGIVTGSFVAVGRDAVIEARLIDVETGVILAACEQKVERDSLDPPEEIGDEAFAGASDGDPCAQAPQRVDDMERNILDVKARYWALRLKEGLSPELLGANPDATISDLALKHEFYQRLQEWSSQKRIPELSPREVERFVSVDGKAYALAQQCGI